MTKYLLLVHCVYYAWKEAINDPLQLLTPCKVKYFCLCKNISLCIVTYACTSSLAWVFMHSLILNTTNLLNQYLNKCCCFNINNKSIEVFWITCNRIVSDFKTRFFHLLKTYSPLLSKAFKAQNTLNSEPPFTGNASVLWASYFFKFQIEINVVVCGNSVLTNPFHASDARWYL